MTHAFSSCTTHIDDITRIDDLLGCGERGVLQRRGKFLSTRFGLVKVQKDNFTHIGMDVLQKTDGSVEITQKTFTDLLRPIAQSPSLWRDRNRALSDGELKTCQSKLGELCVPAGHLCSRGALLGQSHWSRSH